MDVDIDDSFNEESTEYEDSYNTDNSVDNSTEIEDSHVIVAEEPAP